MNPKSTHQKIAEMERGLISEEQEAINIKYEKLIDHLLGTDFFMSYSLLIGILYLSMYVCFMIMYAIYKPELLQKSFEWKVFVPYIYLGIVLCLFLTDFVNKCNKRKLFMKMMSSLFFVGSYHQMTYIYDNILNFKPIYKEIIDWINKISAYFDDDFFWFVLGMIMVAASAGVIVLFGPFGLLTSIVVIQLVFLMFGIIFFVMVLFPIVFYFYQIILWPVYFSMLAHDFYNSFYHIYHFNKNT